MHLFASGLGALLPLAVLGLWRLSDAQWRRALGLWLFLPLLTIAAFFWMPPANWARAVSMHTRLLLPIFPVIVLLALHFIGTFIDAKALPWSALTAVAFMAVGPTFVAAVKELRQTRDVSEDLRRITARAADAAGPDGVIFAASDYLEVLAHASDATLFEINFLDFDLEGGGMFQRWWKSMPTQADSGAPTTVQPLLERKRHALLGADTPPAQLADYWTTAIKAWLGAGRRVVILVDGSHGSISAELERRFRVTSAASDRWSDTTLGLETPTTLLLVNDR
jgi:hypothetical protein